MNGEEKKEVKKDDFKGSWRRDKKGCIGDGSEEGNPLKEGKGDEVTDVNQQGSQGVEEKGEEGSDETEGTIRKPIHGMNRRLVKNPIGENRLK